MTKSHAKLLEQMYMDIPFRMTLPKGYEDELEYHYKRSTILFSDKLSNVLIKYNPSEATTLNNIRALWIEYVKTKRV